MADENKNFGAPQGMYMGPMVYFGTYPMPLPMWQQMYMNAFPAGAMPMMGQGAENGIEKQFKLPFPEDEKDSNV